MSESVNLPLEAAPSAKSSSIMTTAALAPRFMCPYYNVHGRRGVKTRACTGEGYRDVHRLKEHLYRVHARSISCPRCYATFPDQGKVNMHLRSEDRGENICQLTPPPTIDETTTFTDIKKLELKRRPPRTMSNSTEEEQCKEIYRILFPSLPVPESLYVTDVSELRVEQRQAELTTALVKFLREKVSNDPRYAELNSHLVAFMDTARATGVVHEAANLLSEKQKRRRTSSDQPHVIRDESPKVSSSAITTMVDADVGQQSKDLGFLSQTWRLESPHPASYSTSNSDVLGSLDYPPYDGAMHQFDDSWALVDLESTPLPSKVQDEARSDSP